MVKLRIVVCAISCFVCTYSSTAFGAFNHIGVGARPLGLGGAFVALADDACAANYNPAGLGFIDEIQINTTFAQRFKGLIEYAFIGGVSPLGTAGTVGASIGVLSEDSKIYKERTVRLSYGKAFSERLAFGVNLKSFGTSFDEKVGSVQTLLSENRKFFTDARSLDFSVDMGFIVKPAPGLNVGIAAENLVPADVSVSKWTEDNVPINVRIGVAYSLLAIAESTQQESLRKILKSGLGLIEISFRDGENHVHAGAEVWLNRSFALRAGYGVKNATNAATTIALGASAKIPLSTHVLRLDYAFQMLSGDFKDNTTQRFSLNLIF